MSAPSAQAEMLCNRVRKSVKHLRKWARREQVSCYRVYDRDIPEIPLAVDWYDGRLHVAEYARADEPRPDWVEGLAAAVAATLDVPATRVFVKHRQRQRGASQYEAAGGGERFVVSEGGLRFYVNLSDYIDTGLFLDHRPLRARLRAEARGKRVLNLFCYTAAFTVYAAAGGASSSLSIDLSNTYLDWAADNFALNEVEPSRHRLLRDDVQRFVAAPGPVEPFDLAIVDPPTFSNSKRMTDVLDVQRDHAALINGTLRLLRPGGYLYFSTNHRRFKLDVAALASADITDISAATIPPDFRNDKIHRCWRIGTRART